MRKPLLTLALGLMAAAGIIGITVGDTSPFGEAASHRDAPLISEDPTADNTDVYAFVSTDPTRSDYVTLISNYIPLEELPTDKTYQVWALRGDEPASIGFLDDPARGEVVTTLGVDLSGADAVAVTVEPLGGSPQPTTTPVLQARLR